MKLVEQIKAAYEAERRSHRQVTQADEVPGTYDAITTQWLTQVLCSDLPGAEVASLSLSENDDAASSRRRIVVHYNAAGEAAKLPRSVFCKAAGTLENRISLGASGAAIAETNFYNKVRRRLDIEAPRTYYANFDPRTYAYIIVMADMTGQATFCDEHTVVNWDQATRMLTTLAQLHSRFYESNELGTASLPFRRWPTLWTTVMEMPGFAQACYGGLLDAESVIPPRLFRRHTDFWPCIWRSVERHKQLPQTLTHNDVHLKNWYLTNDQSMGLADWQVTAIGHWSRDYAHAVTTALSVENRRRWERELLQFYLDELARLGVPTQSFDEAFVNVRQQLFTSLALWTSTLRPPKGQVFQPKPTAMEFIRRLVTAIDDLDAVDSFD